jgi:hypothetical protein
LKALKRDGILARPLEDSRKVEFTFHEFRSLNSPAVARLYAWAKLEPPSAVIRPPPSRSPRTTPPPLCPTRTAPPNPSPTSSSMDWSGAIGCNGDPTAAPSPAVPPTPALGGGEAPRALSAPPGEFTPQTWAELAKAASDHGDDHAFPDDDAPEPWPDELKPEFLFYQPRAALLSDNTVVDTARGPPDENRADDEVDDASRGPPEVEE